MTTASPAVSLAPESYPTLTAIRAAHHELLRSTSRNPDSPEVRQEVLRFLDAVARSGTVLQARADRSAAQAILDYWVGVLHTGPASPEENPVPDAVLAPFDPDSAPDLKGKPSPFMGLAAFGMAEASRFFGREQAIEELLKMFHLHPVVIVSGPSGSGKSSLVFAGLLPKLHASSGWQVLPVIVPGTDPAAALLRAVCPRWTDPGTWTAELREGLEKDPASFRALVEAGPDHRPAVLVVDQLEELFTLCSDQKAREQFANAVAALAAKPTEHRVVLTIREDFLREACQLPCLKPHCEDNEARFSPSPMSPRELRRVIEQPADMVGLKFDEGIIDELVKEVAGESTVLPLLQFALLRLWENRDRNWISWDVYRKVGSPRQALQRTADAVFKQLPQDLDRQVARLIFQDLVQPSVGVEFVRRRVRRETLRRLASSVTVDGVLDRFVKAGLLRMTHGQDADDDRFEVAHEALIRNWPLLSQWLENERGKQQQRLRLRAAAELSRGTEWDPGSLLSGSLLEEAKQYNDLNAIEREFIRRSQEAVEKKQQHLRRELNKTRAMLAVTLIAGILASAGGVVAYRAKASEVDALKKVQEKESEVKRSAQTVSELKKTNTQLKQTFVELKERPALTVCKDQIDDLVPDYWKERLLAKEDEISRTIRSTGRIELQGHPSIEQLGTGFVAGKNIIIMSPFTSSSREILDDMRTGKVFAVINFAVEACGTPSESYKILRLLYTDADAWKGVALLETEDLGSKHPPLPLAEAPPPPERMIGRPVYTVGYLFRTFSIPREVTDLILGSTSGFKRLSPGNIIERAHDENVAGMLFHDCTTLGGSGGSPVVDLETGKVIGVHKGGLLTGTKSAKENLAQPMWEILKNEKVREILRRAVATPAP